MSNSVKRAMPWRRQIYTSCLSRGRPFGIKVGCNAVAIRPATPRPRSISALYGGVSSLGGKPRGSRLICLSSVQDMRRQHRPWACKNAGDPCREHDAEYAFHRQDTAELLLYRQWEFWRCQSSPRNLISALKAILIRAYSRPTRLGRYPSIGPGCTPCISTNERSI